MQTRMRGQVIVIYTGQYVVLNKNKGLHALALGSAHEYIRYRKKKTMSFLKNEISLNFIRHESVTDRLTFEVII